MRSERHAQPHTRAVVVGQKTGVARRFAYAVVLIGHYGWWLCHDGNGGPRQFLAMLRRLRVSTEEYTTRTAAIGRELARDAAYRPVSLLLCEVDSSGESPAAGSMQQYGHTH